MGVDWDINIKAPTEEPKKANTVLDRMEQHLKRIDAATVQLGEHFKASGTHAEQAGHKHESMFREILSAELAKEAIVHLIEKVVELGEEAIKSAAAEQRMMRVFEANSGSKEAGEAAEKWADALALKTELSEKQTEGALIGLKRVGASDEEAKLATKAAADIAAVSENKDEAFAATISAFERINRTGIVSNKALAPLGIGVKDFKALPSMAGLSTKEIKKRMEEGKVDREDLYRLILTRTNEKAIGERAANNADLLTTKLSKLQEMPERFWKKFAEGKGVERLAATLGKVLEKIDPDSPFGKKIAGFMNTVFEGGNEALGFLVDKIDEIDFDKLATSFKEDIVPAAKSIIGLINPTIEAIERVIRGFHRMHDSVFGAAPASAGLDDFERRRKAQAEHAAAAEDAVPEWLQKGKDMGGGARAWHGKFHVVGEQASAGLAAGISAAAPGVDSAAADLASRAAAATQKKLQVKSPSLVFEDIGAMTAAGFVRGIERSAPNVESAIQSAYALKAPQLQGGGRGGMMGGIVVTFGDLNFYVQDSGRPEENGRRLADAFKKEIRGELFSLLEQMQEEAGA